MSTYLSYFKTRIVIELQYKIQALAGLCTQFFWGFLQIFIYQAFYESSSENVPINFKELVTYIWLLQAFFALVYIRVKDTEIHEAIRKGTLAYELCRPYSLYTWWFVRIIAKKYAQALLRCFPIIIVALLLKEPYNLMLPPGIENLVLFVITLILGSFILTAIVIIVQLIAMYTMNDKGISTIINTFMELLSGLIIPLPLLPDVVKNINKYLPFSLIGDVSYRLYSGNIPTVESLEYIGLQIFWIVVLVTLGSIITKRSLKKVYIQGG